MENFFDRMDKVKTCCSWKQKSIAGRFHFTHTIVNLFFTTVIREIEQNEKIVIAFKYMKLDQKLAGADEEKTKLESHLS